MTNTPSAFGYTSAPAAAAISWQPAHGSASTSKMRVPMGMSTIVEMMSAVGRLRWISSVTALTTVPVTRYGVVNLSSATITDRSLPCRVMGPCETSPSTSSRRKTPRGTSSCVPSP